MLFGKKETPLKSQGMVCLYEGEEVLHQDLASGKLLIYEDRLEMKVEAGNSVKTAIGGLTGAAIGGAIGVGVASSGIKKGGQITWSFQEMAKASASTDKKRPRLVVVMKDGSFYTFSMSIASVKKCTDVVTEMAEMINSHLARG